MRDAQTAAPDNGAQARQQEQPRRTLSFGGSDDGGAEEGNGDGEPVSEQTAQKRERQFLTTAAEPVVPQDVVIGPLYAAAEAGETERRIYSASRRFFALLMSGGQEENEALESMVHPRYGEGLAERLRREAAGYSIKKVRYGRVRVEGEEARQNVRLFGEPGRTAGELVYNRQAGEWYLSAADIDFSALKQGYEPQEQTAGGDNVTPLFF